MTAVFGMFSFCCIPERMVVKHAKIGVEIVSGTCSSKFKTI